MATFILALLLCLLVHTYAVSVTVNLDYLATDAVDSVSALTAIFDDYTPVKDDRFVFTVENSDKTIRFTDLDGACKETGEASLELSEDGLTMTLIVGDANGNVPESLVCTFDIHTPLKGSLSSLVAWKLNDGGEGKDGELGLPDFYEYFTGGFVVATNKPAIESLYTITIPSTVALASGKTVTFQYHDNYYDALSTHDICSDLENNEHDFFGDADIDQFNVRIGEKLMAPVDGLYTFRCYLTNPPQIPDPTNRPVLYMEYDLIHRSQNIYLPTLTEAKLKTISMTYGTALANSPTEVIIAITSEGISTSNVDTLTFETSTPFKFEPTAICSYNDGADIMNVIADGATFKVVLPAGLTLKDFTMVCTGASAPAHDEGTVKVTYMNPNGYGESSATCPLPPMFDHLPLTITFATDNTHPDSPATHTYQIVSETTYEFATTLFLNISQVISSVPQCVCADGDVKFPTTFSEGILGISFPASSIQPYQNIVLTCQQNNRKKAGAYPLLKADFVNAEKNMELISTTTFTTANFVWEMSQLTAQTITFEIDDRKINSDYIRFILDSYVSVYGVFRRDVVIVGLIEEADSDLSLARFRVKGTDYEYQMSVAFKTLSVDQLDAKRDKLRDKLKKKFDDVAVLRATSAREYPKHCTDGKKNNDETDVDCGGSCAGCESNQLCDDDDDCLYGVCKKPFHICENGAASVALWVAVIAVVAAFFF